MSRILENIEKHLLTALSEAMGLWERADFCVGYSRLQQAGSLPGLGDDRGREVLPGEEDPGSPQLHTPHRLDVATRSEQNWIREQETTEAFETGRPAMEIDRKRIAEFCRRWKIAEFSLFGSALREDFETQSDVDVLVGFEADIPWSLFDWIDMKEELESIFGRQVDLVEKSGLRNPFRRHEIMNNRQVIYAG